MGLGIPVDLRTETVIIGSFIKGNYKFPTNVSQLNTPTIYSRRKRSLSRWDVYEFMAQAFQM